MDNLHLHGMNFLLDIRPGARAKKTEDGRSFIAKACRSLDFCQQLETKKPKSLVVLGMCEGGSMVYFDKLYSPTMLIGVDSSKTPIEALDEYSHDRNYIKISYGRAPDSLPARGAVQANCSGGADLVVDDASHLFEQTEATFVSIFLLVKVSGTYLIEDWAWSHRPAAQAPDAVRNQQPALSDLIISLVLMTGVSHVIERVLVTEHLVAVTKGKGVLPATKLDVSHSLRGKSLTLL